MIEGLKPYPGYKESGIGWLGKVPDSWGIEPGFAVFREKQQKNLGMVEKQVLSLSYGRIVVKPPEKLHGLVPDSFETYQIVIPGDIIIRSTDLQNDWNSLRVGFVRNRGIITSAYLCFKVLGVMEPEFGHLQLHAFDLMKVFYGMGSGLRQNLSFSDFKRMKILVPSLNEQKGIIRFIDYANGKIEKAIRVKKKMIALLNEQKQAIIHQAVTRGLDPNVPLKPSSIPWLGEIPKHWNISRFKSEASQIVDCLHATPHYLVDGQFPAVRTADIEPGKVRLKNVKRISKAEYELWTNRLTPTDGDILYSREGERFGIAALVPPNIQLCISQRMMVFRMKPSLCSGFIMWQLNCPHVFAQASIDIIGSTAPHVNIGRIRNFQIVIPPLEEQENIFSWISQSCSKFDFAINRAEQEISLLREYRTRLVADVVTGKLDVRPIADKLPAEIEEVPPSEDPEEIGDETELEPEIEGEENE